MEKTINEELRSLQTMAESIMSSCKDDDTKRIGKDIHDKIAALINQIDATSSNLCWIAEEIEEFTELLFGDRKQLLRYLFDHSSGQEDYTHILTVADTYLYLRYDAIKRRSQQIEDACKKMNK